MTQHSVAWTGAYGRALPQREPRPALDVTLDSLEMTVPLCRRCLLIEAVRVGKELPGLARAAAAVGVPELACAHLAYRVSGEPGPAAWLRRARQTGLLHECGLPVDIDVERIRDGFSALRRAPGIERLHKNALSELTVWILEEQ